MMLACRDLVHLVFDVVGHGLRAEGFNIAELGVEGGGVRQAERQANGEGESFKRVASASMMAKPSSNTNLLVSRPSP
jgi:hypothetical protein